MEPRMILDLRSSCLSLLGPGTTRRIFLNDALKGLARTCLSSAGLSTLIALFLQGHEQSFTADHVACNQNFLSRKGMFSLVISAFQGTTLYDGVTGVGRKHRYPGNSQVEPETAFTCPPHPEFPYSFYRFIAFHGGIFEPAARPRHKSVRSSQRKWICIKATCPFSVFFLLGSWTMELCLYCLPNFSLCLLHPLLFAPWASLSNVSTAFTPNTAPSRGICRLPGEGV